MRTAHRACREGQLHFGDDRDVWCFTASLKAAESIYVRTVAAWSFSLSDSSEADIAVVFSLKDCTGYVFLKAVPLVLGSDRSSSLSLASDFKVNLTRDLQAR